jgi:hypothetical protein
MYSYCSNEITFIYSWYGKLLRKRSLGKDRRRWQHNVKMDLRATGSEEGRWMELAAFGINGVVPSDTGTRKLVISSRHT